MLPPSVVPLNLGMDHLQRLLEIKRNSRKRRAPILSLPPELLLHILSYTTCIRDLHSLSLTCNTLYPLANSKLYKHVEARFVPHDVKRILSWWNDVAPAPTIKQHHRLFITLSQPEIAWVVTTLKLCLPHALGSMSLENHLADALSQLVNLEVLDITCGLCVEPGPNANVLFYYNHQLHAYLLSLGARALKSLAFNCPQSSECGAMIETRRLISTDCMQSLVSLTWDLPFEGTNGLSRMSGEEMQVLANNALPHLEKIQYGVNPLLDCLVGTRNVPYFRNYEWNPGIHSALVSCAIRPATHTELVFLSMGERSAFSSDVGAYRMLLVFLGDLLELVRDSPMVFRNLRHVGVFFFWTGNREHIVQSMQAFAALPLLFSIQVNNFLCGQRYSNPREGDPWDEELLEALSVQHGNLRRVYIYGKQPVTRPTKRATGTRDVFLTWVLTEIWECMESSAFTIDDMENAIPL